MQRHGNGHGYNRKGGMSRDLREITCSMISPMLAMLTSTVQYEGLSAFSQFHLAHDPIEDP